MEGCILTVISSILAAIPVSFYHSSRNCLSREQLVSFLAKHQVCRLCEQCVSCTEDHFGFLLIAGGIRVEVGDAGPWRVAAQVRY